MRRTLPLLTILECFTRSCHPQFSDGLPELTSPVCGGCLRMRFSADPPEVASLTRSMSEAPTPVILVKSDGWLSVGVIGLCQVPIDVRPIVKLACP